MARGDNGIYGLNVVGLRRAGVSGEERSELRRLYRFLFRGPLGLRAAVEQARKEFTTPLCVRLLDFVAACKRGIPADVSRGSRRGRRDSEDEAEQEA